MNSLVGLIVCIGGLLVLSADLMHCKPTPQLATAEIISSGLEGPAVSLVPATATHLGTAISKTVHYSNTPVVAGYSSTVYKPDLAGIQHSFHQMKLLSPVVRSVHTIVPKITHIEPEVNYQKIPVDVPVASPVINEVEVRTPILQSSASAVKSLSSPYYYSAPLVHTVN